MKKKYSYIYETCKCGATKESKKRPYCNSCCSKYYKTSKKEKIDNSSTPDIEIIDFIKDIEKRHGFVTLHDIFVKLITYYTKIKIDEKEEIEIDILESKDQITIMWMELKKWYDIKIK